jgi:photosystem II stability/assembly factor-like uncharacterized protein
MVFKSRRTRWNVTGIWLAGFCRRHTGLSGLAIAAFVFLGLGVALGTGRKPSANHEQESPDLARARSNWFFRQRAFPIGHIPGGLREKAIEQMGEMRNSQKVFGVPLDAVVGANSWTAIGPRPTTNSFFGNVSGRVQSLAVDPGDASGNTVYLGGADGGVWKTTDGGVNWKPITDSAPSLSAASLAIDSSTNPSTIYVGTGDVNLVGDAVFTDSVYGAGVLKCTSADGGTTYTCTQDVTLSKPSPLEEFDGGPRVGALTLDPANNQILLAAVRGSGNTIQSGIWRSTDGGHSFSHVLPQPLHVVGTDVVFDPSDNTGHTAYAALGDDGGDSSHSPDCSTPCNGVWKSTDSGATWARLTSLDGLATQSNVGHVTLTVSGGAVYVAIATASNSSSSLLGVFKTTNGGQSFTQLNLGTAGGFCNSQCFFDMIPKASPTNANVVFLGGSAGSNDAASIFRSTDGGSTWQNVTTDSASGNPVHVDFHALAFSKDGSKLYIGNDGGAWSSTNVTAAASSFVWNNLNNTLQITEFYPGLSIDPMTDSVSYAGAQDNGHQKYSGTIAWADVELNGPCGDGGRTLIDPSNHMIVYAACVDFGSTNPSGWNLINKSTDGGVSWSTGPNFAQLGITIKEIADFVPPLVLDPSHSQTLYFGTFKLYQSTNGAGSWAAISGDLTGGGGGGITAIAVAPSSSNTVYAATGASADSSGNVIPGKVWVTTNAGGTFSEVDTGLPPRWATALAVDPSNSQFAYVTFSGFSGFSGDNQGHVFKTVNGGTVWTDVSGVAPNALPNIPVNDIVIDPSAPATTWYVATDIGVFATTDAGVTWGPLGTGLPNVVVMSLKVSPNSRKLRAATHGRGAWDLALGAASPDFSFGTPNPTTRTIPAGQSTTYTLPINSSGGFSSGVTLSCGGLPAQATCSFSPNPATPPANGSVNSTLTITTMQRSLLPGAPRVPRIPSGTPGLWPVAFGIAFAAVTLAMKRTASQRRMAPGLSFALLVILLGMQMACGGGSGSGGGGGGGGGGNSGTPAGTSTITISGTSGSLQHSTSVTLIVQ